MRIPSLLLTLLICFSVRADLAPENLLLVVNKNNPQGQPLAEYYAKQRHVPDGRIVSLDLPQYEDVPFGVYETNVVAPLRKFLADNHLEDQVRCIVLFWGVPIRVTARPNDDPQDRAELLLLQNQLQRANRL